jgi:hypothetical protein
MIKDVSDLIGIPESQLTRVIRMVVTAGFLQELQPGYVAHSTLSASFVIQPSYLDATIFLAERVAPAALRMAVATKQCSMSSKELTQGSHHIGSNTSNGTDFAVADEVRLPRLQRQWHAYLRHGTGHLCDTVTDVLTCLERFRMANATVVEVLLPSCCHNELLTLFLTNSFTHAGRGAIHRASDRSCESIPYTVLHGSSEPDRRFVLCQKWEYTFIPRQDATTAPDSPRGRPAAGPRVPSNRLRRRYLHRQLTLTGTGNGIPLLGDAN